MGRQASVSALREQQCLLTASHISCIFDGDYLPSFSSRYRHQRHSLLAVLTDSEHAALTRFESISPAG